MLAFPAIETDIFDAQIIRPDLLSLTEGTLFPQHDYVVNVPVPLALAETMKPDHIISIDIQPEAVLGIRMERTEGTVPSITRSFETNAQMGLCVVDDRIEVRCGLDVVVGGNGGIIGKWGWRCQDGLAGSRMEVGFLAGREAAIWG